MCARCDAESADYAAKAQAAYLANGWPRLIAAIRHEDELVEDIGERLQDLSVEAVLAGDIQDIAVYVTAARAVIDAVRAFDEQTGLKRDAHDDHQAQNNERPY